MSTNSTNIFKQTGNLFANWTAGARANFEEQARRRNDGHHYDEALLIVQGLLYAVALVPIALGVYYHWNIAANLGGTALAATLLVGLLTIVAEITKIIFGRYLLRAVFNGVWMQSFADLGLTLCTAAIVVGGFVWSINISTKAVAQISAMKANEQRMTADVFTLPASIAGLDAKIADAEKMSAKAQRSTWSGKPTKEGLDNMAKAETTKQMLLKQREADIAAARKDYEERQALSKSKITVGSEQVGFWGGAAEALTIFLLIFLELLMVKCYERNTEAETAGTTSSHKDLTESGKPETSHLKHQFSDNAAERRPIGFRLQQNPVSAPPLPETKRPETVVTTALQPVSAPETKVLKQTIIRDDIEREVAEQCRNIQRYFSKWEQRGKGGGRPETILANLAQFFKTISELQQEGDISAGMKARVVELHLKYQSITAPQQNQPS